MNNLVVQLLLKTGTFSTDLKTARGQIQNFQKGCQDAGKSLNAFGSAMGVNISALSKFGGVVAAAALAGKELKAIIDSTQTSADAFQGVIAGCTGVVDSFNASIAMADFSTFQNGLWNVYDAAKAARDAIDALQDAQLGYGMISSENNAAFATAMNNYREAKTGYKNAKTADERKKFKEEMDRYEQQMKDLVAKEEEAARNFQYKNMAAIKSGLHARNTNINEKDVTMSLVMQVAEIFNSVNSEEQRKQAKLAAEYVNKEARKYVDSAKRQQYYNQHQSELIIAALLELGDKKIQAVAEEYMAGQNAIRGSQSMRRTMNRTLSGAEGGSSVPRSTTRAHKEELELQEGSLSYWQKILQDETKYRDALVKDTEEWKLHNDKIEEAKAKIEDITKIEEEKSSVMEGSLTWYRQILSEATKLRDETEYGSDAWNQYNEKVKAATLMLAILERESKLDEALAVDPPTIESLQTVLSILQQMRNQVAIDSEEFKELTEMIEKLQEKLQSVTGTAKTSAPSTDPWDKFNQAMANTSTIVSSLTNTFKENSEVTAASVLQMVATCLPAIGSLISAIGALTTTEAVEAGVSAVGKAVSTSKHWIEAIAAVASLGAVVATAIAAASSPRMEKFASGGIVGGSSFTGDRITAGVNSGEMILNKTQQANLFRIANGNGIQGNQVEFHISGTDLVGVLNNNNRKNRLTR